MRSDYWSSLSTLIVRGMQEKYLGLMSNRFRVPIIELPLLADDLIGEENLMRAAFLHMENRHEDATEIKCLYLTRRKQYAAHAYHWWQ